MTDTTRTTGLVHREAGNAAKPRLGWVVGLSSTAYFMVILDALVVITALPRMQHDLHVGLSSLQWTVNAYGIAFAAGIITAAALGDRFGRRRVFTAGLMLFTLAPPPARSHQTPRSSSPPGPFRGSAGRSCCRSASRS
jgi:MFS family permease